MTATLANDALALKAHKRQAHLFPTDRGFHWINKFPLDR
jgi:hypothetical protein